MFLGLADYIYVTYDDDFVYIDMVINNCLLSSRFSKEEWWQWLDKISNVVPRIEIPKVFVDAFIES